MEQIDILIGKKLAGEITDEELDALKKWRAGSAENERYVQQMERLWQRIPARNKAFSRPIDVESALQKTKARLAPAAKPGRVVHLQKWWLAAAAAVAVLIAAVVFFQKNGPAQPLEMASTDVVRHEKLPDGSTIDLNQHSKIRADFSKKGRRIELAGEAFFEVAHDTERPFTVVVGNFEVTAVGTAFNVDESDPARVIVRMAEGKVQLKSGTEIDFLVAGEEAFFERATGRILTSKMSQVAPANAWLDRRFDFDGTPLSEVLPVLEKAYKVRISLKNKELGNCKLRTRFSNEPVERVVEVLAETFSLKIEQADGQFLLDGEGCD